MPLNVVRKLLFDFGALVFQILLHFFLLLDLFFFLFEFLLGSFLFVIAVWQHHFFASYDEVFQQWVGIGD